MKYFAQSGSDVFNSDVLILEWCISAFLSEWHNVFGVSADNHAAVEKEAFQVVNLFVLAEAV